MASFNITGAMGSKTILPSYKFVGEFTQGVEDGIIKDYHIKSVSFEQHTFKHEGQYHGPGILKTFPVMDRSESGAYKLTIVLEEDESGTVFNFIEYLKEKIITAKGIYNKIDDIKNLIFKLTIMTNPERIITFKNVYFQSADASTFSYDSSDIRTYTLNLVYENYEINQ